MVLQKSLKYKGYALKVVQNNGPWSSYPGEVDLYSQGPNIWWKIVPSLEIEAPREYTNKTLVRKLDMSPRRESTYVIS